MKNCDIESIDEELNIENEAVSDRKENDDKLCVCQSCKSAIYAEDENYYEFGGNFFCETCWSENVCNCCGNISGNADYYYCEHCMRHLTLECDCWVISTPQYHGCTCRICFKQKTYFCDLCEKDLYHFVKTTNVAFVEDDTYINNNKYDGLICDTCLFLTSKLDN